MGWLDVDGPGGTRQKDGAICYVEECSFNLRSATQPVLTRCVGPCVLAYFESSVYVLGPSGSMLSLIKYLKRLFERHSSLRWANVGRGCHGPVLVGLPRGRG